MILLYPSNQIEEIQRIGYFCTSIPNFIMNRLVLALCLIATVMVSCKKEHPDLKSAYDLFKESLSIHNNLITTSADLKNQAKILDSKIRNEDKENVFAISEAYNHLDLVDAALNKLPTMEAVPGHEKEHPGAIVRNEKLEPPQILMVQKERRDKLLEIKSEMDAAATLINALKTKLN